MANPAEYPENGPNRFFLERPVSSPPEETERQRYDRADWPGSANFHPPHLQELGREMLQRAREPTIKPEPSHKTGSALGRLGRVGYVMIIPKDDGYEHSDE